MHRNTLNTDPDSNTDLFWKSFLEKNVTPFCPGYTSSCLDSPLLPFLCASRVETLVRNAVSESKGVIKRDDFDAKNISFLSLLDRKVAETALKEVIKRSKNQKVRNRQAYCMGIIIRVVKKETEKTQKEKAGIEDDDKE
jgi:hypothetical protein